VGLAGRRAGCGGAGLRAAVAAGLSAPAGGLAASAPEDGAALGSALMMLTGGIEADEGKNRPGLAGGAEVAGAELGEAAGGSGGTGPAAATAESGDCGHSLEWCNM